MFLFSSLGDGHRDRWADIVRVSIVQSSETLVPKIYDKISSQFYGGRTADGQYWNGET